ncbi:Tensin-1 [Echinococcus granulosus]|uniref:Tensin-1 n=1 Tax=Echinococcus granulosus TaxID=6210 RepID=W6UP02_ECHGR|nr:Tensin-1 [Echinococcus granulosus]EUB55129.1 Tensin-1 [Echinococcus granulosus]
MEVTGTDFGIRDPDNMTLYPAPNFIHSPERIREHMGEVRTPPLSRMYRCEETVSPISRCVSGYSRDYQQKMYRGGFSQDLQASTENYVSSTGGATSPRNFSLSNGASDSYTSSTRFNHPTSPTTNISMPRRSIRETSVRVQGGQDDQMEWSRREESVREMGSSRYHSQLSSRHSDHHQHQFLSSPLPQINGYSPLPPPIPTPTSPGSQSVKITRKPIQVQRNGDQEVITTEEVKKEDDDSETIIHRRTIRRKRVPSSHLISRENNVPEDFQRTSSVSSQRRIENSRTRLIPCSPKKPPYPPVSLYDYMASDQTIANATNESLRSQHFMQFYRSTRGAFAFGKIRIFKFAAFMVSEAPPRTFSQTNIHQYSNTLRNQWSSENNLKTGSYLKQPPICGTYSAHQENLRRRNELNQQTEYLRSSRRMSETGYGEICQEIVSLLPIGRGIQDLESGSSAATLPRAGSHTADLTLLVEAIAVSTFREHSHQYYHVSMEVELFLSIVHELFRMNPIGPMLTASLGCSMGSLHGGSFTTGPAQANHMALDTMDSRHTLTQTNDLSYHWFRPSASRQEAIQMLINKEPGRFIIRASKSQPNSYALVVRVPLTAGEFQKPQDTEPVRTFLLNRVKGGDAVHLRGFESEPIFPSLAAFVHDHTIHQGALPVLLKLPMRSALSSNYLAGQQSPLPGRQTLSGLDFVCDVLYLGSMDVFPLQGESAVRRAVEQVLSQANNPNKGLKKKCEATVLCSVDKGLTIVDKNSIRFTKKSIPANKILYCAYDPEERVFNAIELKNRGVADSLIFAIVVKKTRFTMTEHAVYVMCQLEPNQPSSNLINFINQALPVHFR